MNTRLLNARILILFALTILMRPVCAGAQGFIRQYPFHTWLQGGTQSVFPRADGDFMITATSFGDFAPTVQLLWMRLNAQGQFTGGDTLLNIHQTSTGSGLFLLESGSYISARAEDPDLVIDFIDEDPAMQWTKAVNIPPFTGFRLFATTQNNNGDFFFTGYVLNSGAKSGFVLKMTSSGEVLWHALYPFDPPTWWSTPPVPTDDGGCLAHGVWENPADPSAEPIEQLHRFDGTGNLLWTITPGAGKLAVTNDMGRIFAISPDEHILAPGIFSPDGTEPPSTFLYKLNPLGVMTDSLNLSDSLGLFHPQVRLVFPLRDNGFLVMAEHYILNSWEQYAIRITNDHAIAWTRRLNHLPDAYPAKFTDGKELPDGSLVLYGFQGDQLFLVKMSPEGVIYPHTLTGRVARDSTFNCQPDAFDPPLEAWVLSATGNGTTHYGWSDANGNYTINDLDTGSYQVVLTPPSYLWAPCADTLQVQFSGVAPQTDTADFPVQALYDCPLMQVDIATPFLRRCFGNTYIVNYCNTGNQPAGDVVISVTPDPLLTIDSASIPFTQNGQTLTFNPGLVPAGECGSFKLYATVSCEAELGQTLCVEAHIFPDTICALNLPGWSGAQIEVSSVCEGDSVRFFIRNTGTAPMPQALDFIIVDDHVITRSGMFQLPAGGIQAETVPADGSTWRLIARQEPGYPFGPQKPALGVEGCVNTPSGGFSTGMLNQFPNFTGNPFHDMDCHPVIGAYDPNDKQAFPEGVHDEHHIEANQPLEYLIRFQNTGTDTAFTVVIRDTLSPWLDPATLQRGAASHNHLWSLGGQGILTITFPNIMLPDSHVNERASHGFVRFRIDQKRDNPPGTRIENSAGIYFDFNAPVHTNTVFHTVEKDFLPVGTKTPFSLPVINITPNPAAEQITLHLEHIFQPGQQLILYDAKGRALRAMQVTGPKPEIRRNGLPGGIYRIELRDKNRPVAGGNVVFGM